MDERLVINDKKFAPYLLAASFNNLVRFVRSYSRNGILYWEFAPKVAAQELINQVSTKTDPSIPAQDLFEAIETWWKQIAEMRNGEMGDGQSR